MISRSARRDGTIGRFMAEPEKKGMVVKTGVQAFLTRTSIPVSSEIVSYAGLGEE